MLSVNLGPLALPVGVVILMCALCAAVVAGRWMVRGGGPRGALLTSRVFDVLLVAVIAARLVFIVAYWEFYRAAPWGVLDVRDGGFSLIGGMVGAVLACAWLLWRHADTRKALAVAAVAGSVVWGGLTFGAMALDDARAPLPALQVETLDGGSQSLAAVAGGKPAVINLWAGWCPPCIREMPVLAAAQATHPDIAFVFLNQGEGPEAVREFLTRSGLQLDHVLLDRASGFGDALGSRMLPTTVFYDASGRQTHAHLGQLSAATLARGLRTMR